ncbi:response regulator [Dyadobacter sp. CY323]|uniref:response regulator n=1 Tax=Dyadobacter sp. CY323 TaxID=2907302 RepID=UPI001F2FCFED|nr:response regulator [Dyadobacter sp. CY323]MCE6991953.1 response regulator [Dyadobacter sp. CY323]
MTVRKVLLVDDDVDDIELFLEALLELDAGITCTHAKNGVDALQTLTKTSLPDLIFMDINMPKMNGWDCLKALKNDPHLKHIPIVMYSTSAHDTEVARALSLGAKCLFRKPHSFNELKNTLQKVIGLT